MRAGGGHRNYRNVFFNKMVKLLALRCYFCGKEVSGTKFVVHHIDENEKNNDPDNLALAHLGCHSRHHNTGKKKPLGFGARVSDGLKRHYFEHEHHAKGTTRAAH